MKRAEFETRLKDLALGDAWKITTIVFFIILCSPTIGFSFIYASRQMIPINDLCAGSVLGILSLVATGFLSVVWFWAKKAKGGS